MNHLHIFGIKESVMSKENFETVTVDIEDQMMAQIENQAEVLRITPSDYCRLVLQQWMDTERK